jgi:hypothetical protein
VEEEDLVVLLLLVIQVDLVVVVDFMIMDKVKEQEDLELQVKVCQEVTEKGLLTVEEVVLQLMVLIAYQILVVQVVLEWLLQ